MEQGAVGMRILLIDNDAALRRITARVLVLAGHAVLTAADGAEGLRLWREQGADLVITDIQMPGMNGIEVILQLRSLAPDLPIIAISGGDRSRELDLLGNAKVLGAVGQLGKPFSADELYAAVQVAMGKRGRSDSA
jgi:CheY-like chemotaxis protein